MESAITIRHIQPSDDAALANIIRRTLEEFGANHPGTVYFDASTDHLSDIFKEQGSWYFVAEKEGEVLGGGGIYPTAGLPDGVCELVKMYLLPQGRGTGIGKLLMQHCLDKARELGYQQLYLETMPELTKAIPMYEKFGFHYLDGPLGNSGHFGCAIQMIKDLQA